MAREYIVVCARVHTSPGHSFEIVYNWDGLFFPDRRVAIKYGLDLLGSDDFNVAVIDDRKRLVSFDWMDEPTGETSGNMAEIARQLGFRAEEPR